MEAKVVYKVRCGSRSRVFPQVEMLNTSWLWKLVSFIEIENLLTFVGEQHEGQSVRF